MKARVISLLLLGMMFVSNIFSQTITVLPLNGQYCSGATLSIAFSISSNFNVGNVFSAELSDSNGSFASSLSIGILNGNNAGSINAVLPSGLLFGKQYRIRIVSTSPSAVSLNTQPLTPENVDSDSWVKRQDFGGAPRAYAMAFSIGNKGYIGTGSVQTGVSSDFWEYDQSTDSWTAKRNFGGFVRSTAIAFSIGTKGYAGTGNNNRDFWEYDPASDTWTQKANFPGVGRSSSSAFSIGSKGYVGLGKGSTGTYNDFWQYDPVSNSWTSKSSFPGAARDRAVGFSINNKGYFGLGNDGIQSRSDVWEYDPQNDTWTQKSPFPGGARMGAIAFSIGDKGYVGSGFFNSNKNDFYEFDPVSNNWIQKANTGGSARRYAVGFGIGNRGYISTGIDVGLKNDLWEYSPKGKLIEILPISDALCPGSEINVQIKSGCENFDNGNVFTLQLSDSLGSFEIPVNIGTLTSNSGGVITGIIPASTFTGNNYMVRVISSNYNIYSSGKKIRISSVTSIRLNTAASSENQEVCVNNPIATISYTFTGGQSITATGLPAGINAVVTDSVLSISGIPSTSSSGNTSFQVDVLGGCIATGSSGTISVKPNTTIVTEPSNTDVQYCFGLASTPLDLSSFGTNLAYQWYSTLTPDYSAGIVIAGANSPTFFPSTNTAGEKYYYCVVSGGCGLPDTTILSGKHKVISNGTWLGNNASWFDSGNWCGGVPSAGSNVFIPVSAQDPAISGSPAICNNITIETGAILTLDSQTLKVFGTISSDGNLNALSGTIEMAGNFRQNVNPNSFVQKKISHLRISNNSGVEIVGTDSLKIRKLLDFGSSNCELFTNDKMVIMSDGNGTASVGDLTSDGVNTNIYSGNQIIGNVTVERYIPNHPKAWQFLSAPATGGSIKNNWQEGNSVLSNSKPGYGTIITSDIPGATSPLLGFDIYSTGGPSMKTYNSTTGLWEGIPSTLIDINNPKGYFVFIRGDRSVTAFNQSPTSTTLRTTGKLYQPIGNAPPVISVARDKFASVGNPYASALDMSKFVLTGGVQDVYYIWDPKLTSSVYSYYGLGMYRALVRIGNGYRAVPAETGGTSYYDVSNQNVKIQSGQAFFIHADSALGDGTLTFTESAKSLNSATVTREIQRVPMLFINLHAIKPQEKILLDGALLVMDDDYSNEVDKDDVLKLAIAGSERISISNSNKLLAADMRNRPESGDTVKLVMEGSRRQGYQLQFIREDMQEISAIPVLVDKFENLQIELIQPINEYAFSVSENPSSSVQDRFYIYFKRLQPVSVTFTSVSAVRLNEKHTKISWDVENEMSISNYEVLRSTDGVSYQKISTVQASQNNSYAFTDNQSLPSITYYKIKSIEQDGSGKFSSIAKVMAIQQESPFIVFPNPVRDNVIRIQCGERSKQKIMLNLYSSSGQRIIQTTQETTPGQTVLTMKLPTSLSKGTYTLTVATPENDSYSIPVILE